MSKNKNMKLIKFDHDGEKFSVKETQHSNGYVSIESELTFTEIMQLLKNVNLGHLNVSGFTWSIWLLLCGTEILRHEQKDTKLIPITYKNDLLFNFGKCPQEFEEKIMNTTISLIPLPGTKEQTWIPIDVKVDVTEEEKDVQQELLLHVPKDVEIGQIILYAQGLQSWLLSASLSDNDTVIAENPNVMCGIVLDKRLHGLPVPKKPVFTFSFCDYFHNQTGYTVQNKLIVKIKLDGQFLPDKMPLIHAMAVIRCQ